MRNPAEIRPELSPHAMALRLAGAYLLTGAPVPIASPERLGAARAEIRRRVEGVLPPEKVTDALCASSEALDNALKHAGGGEFRTLRSGGVVQVEVVDHGPGIDFRLLPKATLLPGFSTAQTLDMGFTIMLQLCERVLISTASGRPAIVLEFAGSASGEAEDEGSVR